MWCRVGLEFGYDDEKFGVVTDVSFQMSLCKLRLLREAILGILRSTNGTNQVTSKDLQILPSTSAILKHLVPSTCTPSRTPLA